MTGKLKHSNAKDLLGLNCGRGFLPLMISRHFPIKLSMSACSNDVFTRTYLLGLMLNNFTSHNDRSSSTVTLNLSHASCTISRAIFLCRVLVNSFAYFRKFNVCPLLCSTMLDVFISVRPAVVVVIVATSVHRHKFGAYRIQILSSLSIFFAVVQTTTIWIPRTAIVFNKLIN